MDRRTFLKSAVGAGALVTAGGLATPAISQRAAARTLRFIPQADLANFDPIVMAPLVAAVKIRLDTSIFKPGLFSSNPRACRIFTIAALRTGDMAEVNTVQISNEGEDMSNIWPAFYAASYRGRVPPNQRSAL